MINRRNRLLIHFFKVNLIKTCQVSEKMVNLRLINFVTYHVLCLLCLNSGFSHEDHKNVIKGQSKIYEDLKTKVESIKEQCGSLCNIDPSTYQPISEDSKFYYVPIEKAIDCNGLWNSSIFDESGKFKRPPQKLPKYLLQYFKHHSDMVDIKLHYYDEINSNIWNQTFNTWGKMLRFIINKT